jgi:hypothetical protein
MNVLCIHCMNVLCIQCMKVLCTVYESTVYAVYEHTVCTEVMAVNKYVCIATPASTKPDFHTVF